MIFKLKIGDDANNYAPLVEVEDNEVPGDYFYWTGTPMLWKKKPKLEKFFDRRRKVQKERADIGYFCPGTLVLNRRAYDILHDFFAKFGELLEVDCVDGEAWLFNVTTLIDCVDVEQSEKTGDIIDQEALFENNVPEAACIFKDPHMAARRIYLNQAAKTELENLFFQHKLTGWQIEEAGLSKYY